MSDNIFVDTNVLVYSRDASEPQKQPLAIRWMKYLQVINPFDISPESFNSE
jgi:predicted nucleic acid-binding protein